MAKCDLTIELDDPEAVHLGGGTITGVVRVNVDANVKCNGLVVTSGWTTHGRGNVASGEVAVETLFQGEWQAGQTEEYRFELPIDDWPPSYHGHYLNIDHYVGASVNIPWAFDPKTSQQFLMQPTCGADGIVNHSVVAQASAALKIIGIVMLIGSLLFAGMVISQVGAFGLLFLLFPMAGMLFWFIRVFLPKYLLGDVQCQFSSEQASPGESVTGELIIQPRRSVSINAITMNFEACEECVSGSGSNRKTHKKMFFEKLETLQEATTLTPAKEHRFPFSIELPEDSPYSIDLADNDLIWKATLRVDIPRWPDWVKTIPLQVVPSGKKSLPKTAQQRPNSDATAQEEVASAPSGITFTETAKHLLSVQGDREQLAVLVEAVSGLTFDIEVIVERRLLYSGSDDPHVYKDGYAVWAHCTDPELPMVLYVPHQLADEFEHMGNDVCRGRGTIVGWDSLHERLQVKLAFSP